MNENIIASKPDLMVSDMAEGLVGSEIIKLAGEIKAKILAGETIYNFTIGDFNPEIFPIPEKLKEEIITAYRNNETNYPAANGIELLRKEISYYFSATQNLEYSPGEVLVAGGARPLIYAIFQVLVNPGESVIFPVPSWNNNHYTHLSGGKQVLIETSADNNFMPVAEEIEPFIQDAALIALCSPLNPTGTVLPKENLQNICKMIVKENNRRASVRKKPLYLLYDQIYSQLTFEDIIHYNPIELNAEMRNYTIFVDGISKCFAATGVRVGWSVGPQRVIDKMKSILGHIGAWAPKAEQVATAAFLKDENAVKNYLAQFKEEIHERLVSYYKGFTRLKEDGYPVDAISPQAAIYLTVKIDLVGYKRTSGQLLSNTAEVTKYILDEAKLALVPFYAFGADKNSSWYRLSVGTAHLDEVELVFEKLKSALDKVKN